MSASFTHIIIEICNKLSCPYSNKKIIEKTFLIVDTKTGKIIESIFNDLDKALLSCRHMNRLQLNEECEYTRMVYIKDEHDIKESKIINEPTIKSLNAYFLKIYLNSKSTYKKATLNRKEPY
ncbi:hypothetical protein [Pantoea agglomerans]|uniref:hypothetical protein n=1 Tax=Enterobacter agglomerans TaxID=549 RepID=UPI003C79BF34